MILVGQYDSPFVRRVAVSLHVLEMPFEPAPLSVFGDAEAMRAYNPLGRVPALVLDDGEALIDSAAILDWLDETAGPDRALTPPSGPERRQALQLIALAVGTAEKAVQLAYERVLRPPERRWPEWMARLEGQAARGLAALEARAGGLRAAEGELRQPDITVACIWRYLRMAVPDLTPPGRCPALERHGEACEALPAFRLTRPDAVVYPTAR